MNSRTLIVALVAVGLTGVVLVFALVQKGGQQKIARRQMELEQGLGKITEPMTSSIRNYNPISASKARPRLPQRPSVVVEESREPRDRPKTTATSLTILAAEPQPAKPAQRGPKGDYAPAFRLVKCQLVNTVDSANLLTPIIGLVTDDLWWNGKVIIRAA